jgi:tetratricopeptide (TPR) repeat protein
MRSFLALLRGLERRFESLRFDVRSDGFAARGGDASGAKKTVLDYRHLAAAQKHSGLSVDAWLARARLEDLVLDGADGPNTDLGVLVRSPTYLKAYPDALADVVDVTEDGGKSVLVAVRFSEGAASLVHRKESDHDRRFDHFYDEATRQLPFFSFEGHAFVVEQGTKKGVSRAVCIVGDKAASVAFHASLVKGVLEQLVPKEAAARVQCFSENTACFASTNASEELMAEAKKRAAQLEGDLFADGSDPLVIEREIVLPEVGHGHFDLTLVPEAYFNVRDQALTRSDLGRGHTDYLRGLSFELLGRADLAKSAFERAVRASSSDGEMNLALGRTLSSLGEHSRAVAFLEKAASALPEHAEAINALGVALYRSGSPANARTAFQKAVKLAPDEVGFLVNLGRTCCDERLYAEARAALEHALRVEPSSAEAHASMAVLCHRTGDRNRALHHAREALAEQPDDETVRELLRMLDDEP